MKYAAIPLADLQNWLDGHSGIVIHGFAVSQGIAYFVYE